jgi:DNA-binding transcriptional MerR regulator
MNLDEIADASGIPARTIRFYIARGLLSGPVKAGRGAAYTAEHVAHLGRIKKLQSEGHTLFQIARILGGRAASSRTSRPTAWWQHAIADDIVVWVRGDISPWRMKQIHRALDEFASGVDMGNSRTEKE